MAETGPIRPSQIDYGFRCGKSSKTDPIEVHDVDGNGQVDFAVLRGEDLESRSAKNHVIVLPEGLAAGATIDAEAAKASLYRQAAEHGKIVSSETLDDASRLKWDIREKFKASQRRWQVFSDALRSYGNTIAENFTGEFVDQDGGKVNEYQFRFNDGEAPRTAAFYVDEGGKPIRLEIIYDVGSCSTTFYLTDAPALALLWKRLHEPPLADW